MKKVWSRIIFLFSISGLVACGNHNGGSNKNIQEERTKETTPSITAMLQEETVTTGDSQLQSDIREEPISETLMDTPPIHNTEPKVVIEDYSEIFDGRNGCAILYDDSNEEYHIYNETMVDTEVSPYSTFKIVATLMGLKNNVLVDENTTMKYNNSIYSIDLWNHNLTLYEAFQASCVWYFRQVIDGIGSSEVQKELKELNYGNQDISEWNGAESDSPAELKGFWLGSSLKISPKEQVQVMEKIFGGDSNYTEKQIILLKSIMLTDQINNFQILGKTGTGMNQGWYVGIAKRKSEDYYFAVYMDGEQETEKEKNRVSGAVARSILVQILEQME